MKPPEAAGDGLAATDVADKAGVGQAADDAKDVETAETEAAGKRSPTRRAERARRPRRRCSAEAAGERLTTESVAAGQQR